MGRACYQLWRKVWPPLDEDPSSSNFEKKFSRFTDAIQKVVFSKTLKRVNWQNTRLAGKNLEAEINELKRQPGKNMVIVGGPKITRAFTKLNLIDEYQIYLHPIIYPKGGSLLGMLKEERPLKLIGVKVFKSGTVRLELAP